MSLISTTFATSISSDFNVKMSSMGDQSYTTHLTNVSYYNTDITFQFTEVSAGSYEEYSTSLPAGFVFRSSDVTGTTCANLSLLNTSNNNFHFSFSGTTNPCIVKTAFTYRITTSAPVGQQTIDILSKTGPSSWSILSNVLVDIQANNAITRALTSDTNGNGFIDAYLLSFATGGVNVNSLSGITIAGVSRLGATASGSDWLIHFTDGVLDTGALPQLSGPFDGVTLSVLSVNHDDGTSPIITNINSTNTLILTSGQSVLIGTGAFPINFSERMMLTTANAFSLKLGASNI